MSLRAGPLSDEKVIALLNGYFIPVYAPYTSEETAGVVSTEQEKEIQRIWNESLQKKLPYGMVHVYLLEPGTGQVFDALGVVKASVTNNLLDHDSLGYTCQIYQSNGLVFRRNTIVGSRWGCLFRDESSEPPGSNYRVERNIFVETSDGPSFSTEGSAGSWGTYAENVSDDGSASGPGSVRRWSPRWYYQASYRPRGLPFPGG